MSSGNEYEKCISLAGKTCDTKFMIGNLEVGSYDACKNRCEQDARCKFVFYIPGKHCNSYASCDTMRSTNYIGSTYSKYGNCPGSKNGHMSVWGSCDSIYPMLELRLA